MCWNICLVRVQFLLTGFRAEDDTVDVVVELLDMVSSVVFLVRMPPPPFDVVVVVVSLLLLYSATRRWNSLSTLRRSSCCAAEPISASTSMPWGWREDSRKKE